MKSKENETEKYILKNILKNKNKRWFEKVNKIDGPWQDLSREGVNVI